MAEGLYLPDSFGSSYCDQAGPSSQAGEIGELCSLGGGNFYPPDLELKSLYLPEFTRSLEGRLTF